MAEWEAYLTWEEETLRRKAKESEAENKLKYNYGNVLKKLT